MKVRDVISLLRTDGWYLDRIRGSHRQYRHVEKPGVVTVPGKLSSELHPKTLRSILKQAQVDKNSVHNELRPRGAMSAREARTQAARVSGHTGAAEDTASRRSSAARGLKLHCESSSQP